MPREERDKIMEKRSSLRSWRERGGKIPGRAELIGGGLIILIFLVIVASSFFNLPQGNSSSPAETPIKTPAPTPVKTQAPTSPSIPAPSITIYSPENTTYNTSTPPLNFIAAGSNLKSVMVSVDGGPDVVIPHDGTLAKIDFGKGNPLFIDDFSGITKGRWTESGSWSVEGGRYITTGGTASFGDADWDDYVVEVKTRILSGSNAGIGIRKVDTVLYYLFQALDPYKTFRIVKFISGGNEVIQSADASAVDPSQWHTIKIASNKNEMIASVGGKQYLKYTDTNNPYLKGGVIFRSVDTNVEYDSVQVYKSLLDGDHKLTIFAQNAAGNASSQTIYFTVNSTPVKAVEDIGKIGVPLVKNGFEVTVKSVMVGDIQTTAWLSVKNIEDSEKPFKLNPTPVILDDLGNQYESIKFARGAEISQTTLYGNSIRGGAIFFERFKQGASAKKLILYINGDKFEYTVNQ